MLDSGLLIYTSEHRKVNFSFGVDIYQEMKPEDGHDDGLNEFPVDEGNKYLELLPRALDDELKELELFLGQTRYRICRRAQSIITRSEVELFGTSQPRFATRIYFSDGSLVNCRRLEYLIKHFPKNSNGNYGKRYTDSEIDKKSRNRSLQEKEFALRINVPNRGCIADCIISLPPPVEERGFTCIRVDQANLFKTYTELETKSRREKKFTPFVKAIRLGGGQCAQAACFVATISLARFAKSLCGIAEITAYAHPEGCLELSLSGLTPAKMNRYFRRVGLNMGRQTLFKDSRASLSGDEKINLAAILRCYLQSDMPIIFPADVSKLHDNIYEGNGIRKKAIPSQGHVFILMGYNRENDFFLFHDSAHFPYMTADVKHLANVGYLRDGDFKEIADNGLFFPVTPSAVKLSLGWDRKQDSDEDKIESRMGLISISDHFHKIYGPQIPNKPQASNHRTPFLLKTHLDTETFVFHDDPTNKRIVKHTNDLVDEINKKRNFPSGRWFWFEMCLDGILVWNAEIEPESKLPETMVELHKYLLGMVTFDGKTHVIEQYIIII